MACALSIIHLTIMSIIAVAVLCKARKTIKKSNREWLLPMVMPAWRPQRNITLLMLGILQDNG
jgi:hypothetical protein